MIKVAFWYDRPQEYAGGLNYLRNLIFAISRLETTRIRPYIYFGTRVSNDIVREFEGMATVIRTRLLDIGGWRWKLQRLLFEVFGSMSLIHRVVKKHGIQVVSHGALVYGRFRPFLVVHWIPDFQYLHLPDLFPETYVGRESRRVRGIAQRTDAVILSSRAALADFQAIVAGSIDVPVVVLPFVSQPTLPLQAAPAVLPAAVQQWLGPDGRFLYLPNQFWAHKNHAVVFEAVRLARSRGVELKLVCTGNLRDYRRIDNSYSDQMLRFVAEHGLEPQILILGAIEYRVVLALMADSIAVINPSRFEGWSSTVEEARSQGKRLILSDIAVHREQDPPRADYFDPDDALVLCDILTHHWRLQDDPEARNASRLAHERLTMRTLEFARGYESVIIELTQKGEASS